MSFLTELLARIVGADELWDYLQAQREQLRKALKAEGLDSDDEAVDGTLRAVKTMLLEGDK